LKLKEDFSTLFPQAFHYTKANKDKGFGNFFTRFGIPLLVFHTMWICASLTFSIFVLTKGSTLAARKKQDEIEKEYENEDTRMMKRLVDARKALWT